MGLGSWVLTLTSLVRSISCSNACILATFSSGLVLSDRIDQSMEPKFVTKATIEILLTLSTYRPTRLAVFLPLFSLVH